MLIKYSVAFFPLAALGLVAVQASSGCSWQGLLCLAAQELLSAVAVLATEHEF